MFRHNFRNLMMKPFLGRKLPTQLPLMTRLSLLNTVKMFPKRPFSNKGSMFKFSGRKGDFNSKLNQLIENLVSKLPNGNIGAALVAINTAFYLLYLLWPRDIMHKFLNNFTISNYNIGRGRFHTLLFAHFAHMGFLSYLLDSVILYLF